MAVTTYRQWLADGSPWKPSAPAAAMAAHCRAHGVAYGIIGAVDTHLDVSYPEDHAPYSHTPWPGPQPYPYVCAVDLMTTDPKVARRLIAAKRAGVLPCLKYINWTDERGACWHTSWQPDEVTRSSADRGHIHLSFRTDHVICDHAARIDPFTEGADMIDYSQQVPDGPARAGNPGRTIGQWVGDLWSQTFGVPGQIAGLAAKLDALTAAVHALATGGTSVDTAAVLAAVHATGDSVTALHEELAAAHAEIDRLTAAERAAAQAQAAGLTGTAPQG